MTLEGFQIDKKASGIDYKSYEEQMEYMERARKSGKSTPKCVYTKYVLIKRLFLLLVYLLV
jgi:sensor domain CHASE-containing protein